jgi:hypothetical protein
MTDKKFELLTLATGALSAVLARILRSRASLRSARNAVEPGLPVRGRLPRRQRIRLAIAAAASTARKARADRLREGRALARGLAEMLGLRQSVRETNTLARGHAIDARARPNAIPSVAVR